jgi:predicted nucleic acid-binding protein
MAGIDAKRFARALAGFERIGLDTPILIYHLEDIRPYSELTTQLLAQAAAGAVQLLISTVTVAELLVGAWRKGDDAAVQVEGAVLALPGASFVDVNWAIAARAAQIRAQSVLPLPDALIVATALHREATAVLTNDAAWRTTSLPSRVLVLEDFLSD